MEGEQVRAEGAAPSMDEPSAKDQRISLEPDDDDEDQDDQENDMEVEGGHATDEETSRPGEEASGEGRNGEAPSTSEGNEDLKDGGQQKLLTPVGLSVLRPTLRGIYDAEAGTWIGEWAMSDHEFELGVRGQFEYRRTGATPDVDIGKPPALEGQPADMLL
jgi:hypothetical protein